MALILISHAVDKTIETRTGEYTKTTPSLPDRARNVVLGLVDIILYGDRDLSQRCGWQSRCRSRAPNQASPTYEAGDRTVACPRCLALDYAAFNSAFTGTASNSTAQSPAPGKGTVASLLLRAAPPGKAVKQ